MKTSNKKKIAIVGLGYVGLALLAEAVKTENSIVGFDVSEKRTEELRKRKDTRGEFEPKDLAQINCATISSNPTCLDGVDIFIVTVPTPIRENKETNLDFVYSAIDTISPFIRRGSIIVFESTVSPGCTMNECVPRIAQNTGLQLNIDFAVGFSPERVVPGKGNVSIKEVVKLVSASVDWGLSAISQFYSSIIPAGIYECKSIEIAEASKLIENIQRDVNIALMNEVSCLLRAMDIPTLDVIDAASTKWNFARYEPGLVGGHCIAVDPYYLIEIGDKYGLPLELCKQARQINDNVRDIVFQKLLKTSGKVLCLGITFKENCSDVRQSLAMDIVNELRKNGKDLAIFDPHFRELNTITLEDIFKQNWDCICIFVKHNEFVQLDINKLRKIIKVGGSLYDIKGIFRTSSLGPTEYWTL